jgi:RNA recognition motif-containing protein
MDIYVGNLAYSTNDESLRVAFSAYGEVASARVVSDRMTGRSKGFGFVEMPDRAQAQSAIDALNGKELDGRTLRVNESQPKPREERGGAGGGGGGGFRGGAGGGGGGGGFRGGAGGGRGGAGGRGGERRESRW